MDTTDFEAYIKQHIVYVGDGKVWIARRNPDFIHTTKKIIIEYDSKYYHRNKQRDIERNKNYAKYGFKTISLNEDDLISEKTLVEKIKMEI